MTALSAGDIMRRWFEEVWHRGDAEAVARYMAPTCTCHGVGEEGEDLVGPEAFRAFCGRIRSAFSEPRFTVHEVVAAGPLAAARWTVTLTHDGGGLGVPPTGRQLTFSGMSMLREEGGKVQECWDEWNRVPMATLLGQLAAPR